MYEHMHSRTCLGIGLPSFCLSSYYAKLQMGFFLDNILLIFVITGDKVESDLAEEAADGNINLETTAFPPAKHLNVGKLMFLFLFFVVCYFICLCFFFSQPLVFACTFRVSFSSC